MLRTRHMIWIEMNNIKDRPSSGGGNPFTSCVFILYGSSGRYGRTCVRMRRATNSEKWDKTADADRAPKSYFIWWWKKMCSRDAPDQRNNTLLYVVFATDFSVSTEFCTVTMLDRAALNTTNAKRQKRIRRLTCFGFANCLDNTSKYRRRYTYPRRVSSPTEKMMREQDSFDDTPRTNDIN